MNMSCMLLGSEGMFARRAPGVPGAHQINIPAIYPNTLPFIPSLGCPFHNCKSTSHSCMIGKKVVARECNDNISLSWNHCLLSWARKEVHKFHCAGLGQPYTHMLPNGWRRDSGPAC